MEPEQKVEETSGARSLEDAVSRLERQVGLLADGQRGLATTLGSLAEKLLGSKPAAAPPPPKPADPLVDLVRAVSEAPQDPRPYSALGLKLVELGRAPEAEALLKMALKIDETIPMTHTTLGCAYRAMGRTDEAIASFGTALGFEWRSPARRLLADYLVELGRVDEAFALLEAPLAIAPHDPAPLRECVLLAMRLDRLDRMEEYAARSTIHTASSRYWPVRRADDPKYAGRASQQLKAPRLRHDIEQLVYLRERGLLDAEFDAVIDAYRSALERITPLGDQALVPLDARERKAIGDIYDRIVHVTPAPRLKRALAPGLDLRAVEADYLENPPGIIAIDGLLSEEALTSLRRFLLESTIWSVMRYQNGYLGSFIEQGFNAPLLTQIAEELRAAMPRVIGKSALQNMWGFKYDQEMTGINLHADPAAVNVNFWLTPDDANLDPTSGGLVVYDVEAPPDWAFTNYNGGHSTAEIQAFLEKVNAKSVSFAHKQNRAVIFNSDLFHMTAPFKFRPGYENRRLNVTMLYGTRREIRRGAAR